MHERFRSGQEREVKRYKGSIVLLWNTHHGIFTTSCGTTSFKDSLFYQIKMRFFSTICVVAAGLANAVRGDCKIFVLSSEWLLTY
jgi:hypothetical protein